MVARTKTVGTKVTPEIFDSLSRVAREQNKTVADVMREMIDQGLSAELPKQLSDEALDRIIRLEQQVAFHHNSLGELILKAVHASAGAKYFARLSTAYAQDLTSFVSSQKPLDSKVKKEQMNQFNIRSKEFEEEILRAS